MSSGTCDSVNDVLALKMDFGVIGQKLVRIYQSNPGIAILKRLMRC